MSTVAIIEEAVFDHKAARAEIQIAWENHKRNGMEFGKVCYQWGQRVEKSKGGHGSAGQGLSEILNVLQIPRHIFDYWSKAYELSIGGGIRCPDCRCVQQRHHLPHVRCGHRSWFFLFSPSDEFGT
jgi:hypothetical protein